MSDFAESDIFADSTDREILLEKLQEQNSIQQPLQVKRLDGTLWWTLVSMRLLTVNGEKLILSTYSELLPNPPTQPLPTEEFPSLARLDPLLATLQSKISQQAMVAYLGQQALIHSDLSALIDEAVCVVAKTLDVEYCKLLELMPGGHAFWLRAGVGWQKGLVGNARVSAHINSQAGYTLLKNETIVVDDLRVETRFSGTPLLHNHRVISGMSMVIARWGQDSGLSKTQVDSPPIPPPMYGGQGGGGFKCS